MADPTEDKPAVLPNEEVPEMAPTPERPFRQPGALRGKIWMAADFDITPIDILAAMEGDEPTLEI